MKMKGIFNTEALLSNQDRLAALMIYRFFETEHTLVPGAMNTPWCAKYTSIYFITRITCT